MPLAIYRFNTENTDDENTQKKINDKRRNFMYNSCIKENNEQRVTTKELETEQFDEK